MRRKDIHDISDHNLIYCNFKFTAPAKLITHVKHRSFRYFRYESFQYDLFQTPFFHVFDIHDANRKAEYLTDSLLCIFDIHAPFVQFISNRPRRPWFTDTIKLMQDLRNKAFARYQRRKTTACWEYYKSLRNLVNGAIIRERKAYFETQLRRLNNTWTALRNSGMFKKNQVPIPPFLGSANDINNHFIAVVPRILGPDLLTFGAVPSKDAFLTKLQET